MIKNALELCEKDIAAVKRMVDSGGGVSKIKEKVLKENLELVLRLTNEMMNKCKKIFDMAPIIKEEKKKKGKNQDKTKKEDKSEDKP